MSPARFNVGDIVEAQFVFLLVPVERNQQRLQLVLQGLTLLENSFSRVRIFFFFYEGRCVKMIMCITASARDSYFQNTPALCGRHAPTSQTQDRLC